MIALGCAMRCFGMKHDPTSDEARRQAAFAPKSAQFEPIKGKPNIYDSLDSFVSRSQRASGAFGRNDRLSLQGSYEENGVFHAMAAVWDLQAAEGRVTGQGTDDIGFHRWSGWYSEDTGRLVVLKQYDARRHRSTFKHGVEYRGYLRERGNVLVYEAVWLIVRKSGKSLAGTAVLEAAGVVRQAADNTSTAGSTRSGSDDGTNRFMKR